MNCPHCGILINGKPIVNQCAHCGLDIYYGLDGYSKSRDEALVQSQNMQSYLEHLEAASRGQKEYFSSAEYKNQISKKAGKSHIQAALDSAGCAFIYAIVFTLLTAPLLYFYVQPEFLKSYEVDALIVGAFLFYFTFGFAVIFATNLSSTE